MQARHLLAFMASASAIAITMPAFAAEASKTAQIEEVVVTADKRAENLQVVAGSVSAKTGALLEQNKLEQLSDYAAYIPGLVVGNGGSPGQASISVRGISPGIGTGTSIANYIDETPLGTSGGFGRANQFQLDLLPFDLDRLELLRGPQGTLYGAASIGGVLKYVMKTPDTSHFDAEIGADAGGIDGGHDALTTLNGRVNIPIKQDEAAVTISLFDKHSPGYIDNLQLGLKDTNTVDQYGGRAALFWRFNDQFSLKFSALYQHTRSKDNDDVSYVNVSVVTQPNLTKLVTPVGGYDDRLTENRAFLQPFTETVQNYAVVANWNPGPVDVISATSFSRTHTFQVVDNSAALGPQFPALTGGAVKPGLALFQLGLDLDKFTEEVRVVSPHDQPIEWILGGFYTHESLLNVQTVPAFDLNYNPIPQFAPLLAFGHSATTYEEAAIFGDATWHLTQKFDVTGGLRLSRNHQTGNSTTAGAIVGNVTSTTTDSSSASVTTWMADARYRFTPDVMAYARVATGYRPGEPESPVPGFPDIPTSVDAETLTNYEVGVKTEFWDHRALVNIAAYDIEWKDIQLNASIQGIGFVSNGGLAKTRGFEFESQFTPIQGLNLGLNAAYTEAALDSLKPTVSTKFLLHSQLATVPRWTVSGTADYEFQLPADWRGHVGGGIRWVGDEWVTERVVNAVMARNPAYTAVDLNASASKGKWTYLAYVRNLTNTRAIQGAAVRANRLDVVVLQPLTIGVGFKANFD